MQEQIYKITHEIIKDDIYFNHLITTLSKHSYYWSDDWSEEFYIALAKRGFISVSHHNGSTLLLLPELQLEYGVLEFENLHVSKKVQKLINKDQYSLCINSRFSDVLNHLSLQHDNNWLKGNYVNLLESLNRNRDIRDDFIVNSIELIDNRTGQLVAGEVGYSIGTVYTSLSGFSSREKKHNNAGTLQIVLLARYLHKRGFSFWNMGHPNMEYKKRLGSITYNREEFLQKYYKATNNKTVHIGNLDEI